MKISLRVVNRLKKIDIVTKCYHDSESQAQSVNSEDSGDDSSEENGNSSSDDYVIGRDICKWRKISFFKQGKIKRKNIVEVCPDPKPSARGLRNFSSFHKITGTDVVGDAKYIHRERKIIL
jgi:hypothetical protein